MTPHPPERPLPPPIPGGTLAGLRAALADPWRKPLPRVLAEAARAAVRARSHPGYYFKHLLHRVDVGDAGAYLTRREVRRIHAALRSDPRAGFLANKLLFHGHFRGAGVRLPRLLGYSLGPVFFSEGTRHPLESAGDLLRLAESLASRSASGGVFAKPIAGKQGRSCVRLDTDALAPGRIDALAAELRRGGHLFEEAVVQHPLLAAMHPPSVNTLRILTGVQPDGSFAVLSAMLRVGARGSPTDNGSAGGLMVRVDPESGALAPYGRKLREHGGTVHFEHPDTGFAFAGVVLPHFGAAVEAARAAAAHLPHPLVGWDVATTPDGPVLIEGNHEPHLLASGMVEGGFRHNPAFRGFIQALGLA